MTVLAIVQCWNKDDATRGFTVEWIEYMADEAGHIVVLALEKRHESADPRVEVYSLGKEHYQRFARGLYYLFNWHRTMRWIMKNNKPDLIFTHMTPLYSVLAYPYARAMKIPIVTWFLHPRGSATLWLAHALSTHVVSASLNSYPYPDNKLIPIGHGINTDFFTPDFSRRDANPLIISIGRITPIKNYALLIEAAAILKKKHVGLLSFAIIGSPITPSDYVYYKSLKRLTASLGLETAVRFIPAVSREELRDWYRRATLHVNCTEEGSGDKVILESMACGTPSVVASPVFKDVFGDYAVDFIFSGESAADLALRMQRAIETSPSGYRAISEALRTAIMARYSLQSFCRRLIHALYAAGAGRK